MVGDDGANAVEVEEVARGADHHRSLRKRGPYNGAELVEPDRADCAPRDGAGAVPGVAAWVDAERKPHPVDRSRRDGVAHGAGSSSVGESGSDEQSVGVFGEVFEVANIIVGRA